MHVTCPACDTAYTLDDAAVPRRRLSVLCPVCGRRVQIDGTLRSELREAPAPGDSHGWARRLARALISDILVYHRTRRDAALAEGRLLVEFATELGEAWETYKAHAGEGEDYAPHFREAVNDILAGGEPLLDPA